MRIYYTLGQVQRAQGRLSVALSSCQQGLELAAEGGRTDLPVAGVAHVGIAEVLYERNELDAALDHATRGVALCGQLGYAQWLGTGLAALARIQQARGDQVDALEAIGEAERLVPNPDTIVDFIFPVAVQRARLLLAQGKVDDAARWCTEHEAVAVEEGAIADLQHGLLLLVGHPRHQPQRHPPQSHVESLIILYSYI